MTDEEREVLEFAAGHRIIIAGQIAVVLDARGTDRGERMLTDLTHRGLVRHHHIHHGQAGYHQITSRGLAAINSPLPEPRFETIRDHVRDVTLPWLTLAAHRGRFGEINAALTERVMRHHDTTRRQHDPSTAETGEGPRDPEPEYGVALGTGLDRTVARHYSDLALLLPSGHRVDFQLQPRHPQPRRLAAHITAYAADPHVSVIVYLITDPHHGDTITHTAERLGLSHVIRVHDARLNTLLAATAQ